MRARRLRRLYLAARQRVDLEDPLEAHRWLAIRLLRRACLPSCSAGASTGDGGRPARFIRCIHNCDLTRNWIGSHGTKPALERSEGLVPWVLVITRRPTAHITRAVATRIWNRIVSVVGLDFNPPPTLKEGRAFNPARYWKAPWVSLMPQPPPVVTPPQDRPDVALPWVEK